MQAGLEPATRVFGMTKSFIRSGERKPTLTCTIDDHNTFHFEDLRMVNEENCVELLAPLLLCFNDSDIQLAIIINRYGNRFEITGRKALQIPRIDDVLLGRRGIIHWD